MSNEKFVKKSIIIEGSYLEDGRSIILTGKFKNFSGRPTDRNPAGGKRYFNLALSNYTMARYGIDELSIDALADDGWNVKMLAPRNEGDPAIPFIKVNVAFGDYPPTITLVTDDENGNIIGETQLDADSVSVLDKAIIEKVRLSIRPYNYEPGKVSGYLSAGYFKIRRNSFDDLSNF